MRKAATLLVCIALIASACRGDEGGDETTTAEATPTTEEPADVERICAGAAEYGADGACAYYAEGVSSQQSQSDGSPGDLPSVFQDFVAYDPGLAARESFCLVEPDHVFVFPDNVEDRQLVLPENLEPVEDFGDRGFDNSAEVAEYLANEPLGLYRITDGQDVFAAIDTVEGLNVGVVASPNYLLTPTPPAWDYGPHGAAQRINGSFADLGSTGPESSNDGRVIIIDTGVIGDSNLLNLAEEEPEVPVDARVAGHGLFAASVARQFNESSLSIEVYAADLRGLIPEDAVIAALLRAEPSGHDVVSLSLGTYVCRDEDPPLSLIQSLSTLPEDVLVAAASGNDRENQDPQEVLTMWPASAGFPGSISGVHLEVLVENGINVDDLSARITAVGSMDQNGDESTWSNPSEVRAPGEDVVGLYSNGSGSTGLAVWSGTSFATPHFAACLASGVCNSP